MPDLNISERLMELIFSAIEEGLNTLKSEQGLVPFALLLTKEGVVLQRFSDEDIGAAIEAAQDAVTAVDEDALAYVIVYDGQIEISGKEDDALMIEAGERDKEDGWRFVQRYQTKIDTNPLYPIGDIAYLGVYKNYIS